MRKFRDEINIVLASLASILVVAGAVYAASTISTSITTDDNLTVAGTVSFTGTAVNTTLSGGLIVDTSTLVADYSTNRVGIGTSTPGTVLGVNGDAVIAGLLTMQRFNATSTTAGTSTIQGGLTLATGGGNVGIGTTSPFHQLGIDSAGTTTIGIGSTAANRGGCIQLQGADGVSYRIYANATTTLLWTDTSDGVLIVESGPCW
ncbi:hypothetical protein A2757_01510 [Candidatus Giovannonibacteria bacterium RIFCSPHIGHO2_01_FULL_48_47]|nr:MAG: hypothetical protein A2757_01510 [Candidatus Giovannonibacteria bacterium RIFCSPHIGHO2_01_FULL_48_47]OGF68402.1 MAG: hypothetical protein A3D61_00800 [Candidatus Giovannonibacteria bacterium RIFCSPHIGHO2_02_FULL_48_15]OGF87998.1 MAG: hypothetical protein A3B26_03855 [Candidatus Giovannonibacteria bacterium RIFCSPLOWO2_01_FULL_48_47]OGF96142.1 MAG: hypothetical protein A2613_01055 [Candidatus Giovannonibacteria bacterium RIFOXYD1_FULL_48_21]HBT81334.1 hypothetical protein [Candidatus Gio